MDALKNSFPTATSRSSSPVCSEREPSGATAWHLSQQHTLRHMLLWSALTVIALPTAGCAGLWGHLGYWSGASFVEPEYQGLEGQRVAVICVTDGASYGTGTEDKLLGRSLAGMLKENVDDIEIVPATEVADWIDKNDWDAVDYREVGRGVKADRVVAVDMIGFRLHQNQLLYKANADLTLTVYDMADGGKEVFHRNLPEITYPTTGYYHTTETSESQFRRAFLKVLAQRTARHFYPYDSLAESNLDPAHLRGEL